MKYGPFSDGEAETIRRGPRACKKMSRGRGGTPHYATMSRVHDMTSYKQSSLESNEGPVVKYTSQPQLNGSMADYIGNTPTSRAYYNPGSDALTPLSLKTSITFPRQQPGLPGTVSSGAPPVPGPKPPERKPLCSLTRQDNVRSSYDSSSNNYPDLARHPLSYSVAPPQPPPNVNRYSKTMGHPVRHSNTGYPSHVQFSNQMTRSFGQNRQNSSDDGHFEYEHSRSSSLGDLWGFNGVQDTRMATPDGFKSLPYDNVKLAVNGVKKRTGRSGAVKIDLTCADKSIRRPGSAPDLVGAEEVVISCNNSPGANSIREKKNGSFKDRARSTSSESRENCAATKKVGVSPGTRKVAFAGIEDDDSESESEKQSRDSITSVEEDVWVKQAHKPRLDPESVQTSGVVIAKAGPGGLGPLVPVPGSAPPPPPPHQQPFQSSKLQQPQNKCNGVR